MNLPKPTTNPNAPNWAQWTIETNQTRMDEQYLIGSGNSVAHWQAAVAAQKVEQNRLRDASPDPEHFNATFTVPLPEREISDWNPEDPTADSMGFVVRRVVEPTVTPTPTLDPYVKPAAGPPKGISVTTAQDQQLLILNMLAQALKDMAAIKAKLGIQ